MARTTAPVMLSKCHGPNGSASSCPVLSACVSQPQELNRRTWPCVWLAPMGKRRVIKFAGHFHGWHEGLEVGVQTPYETVPEPGQMQAVDAVALCPQRYPGRPSRPRRWRRSRYHPRTHRWPLWHGGGARFYSVYEKKPPGPGWCSSLTRW